MYIDPITNNWSNFVIFDLVLVYANVVYAIHVKYHTATQIRLEKFHLKRNVILCFLLKPAISQARECRNKWRTWRILQAVIFHKHGPTLTITHKTHCLSKPSSVATNKLLLPLKVYDKSNCQLSRSKQKPAYVHARAHIMRATQITCD